MMIQECPALKSVGLAIDSQDHARKLVATLATRGCPNLDTIVLDSLSLFPIERPAMRVFIQEMVSHAVIASLESLVVRGLQWMPLTRLDEDGKCAEVPRDELTQAPSFPFPVHSLAFERVSIPFPDLLTLMPRPALLRSFTLTTLSDATDSIVSTATMEYLAALLGPYLTSLTLGAAPYKISYDRHHRYQRYHSGPTLPIDLFQSFPLLEHLNLTAMRGMQLNYLGTLFKSSPALVISSSRSTTSPSRPCTALKTRSKTRSRDGRLARTTSRGNRSAARGSCTWVCCRSAARRACRSSRRRST